jgi:hypothetical protein
MDITVKFDHTQTDFSACLGLSKYEMHYVKAAIVFETIASATKVVEFYDSPKDAPQELTTISGNLERCLKHCKTDGQKIYLLLHFQAGHRGTHEALEEASKSSKKESMLKGDDLGSVLKSLVDVLKSEGMRHTIAQIRKCNYDFDKFVETTLPEEGFAKDKDSFKDIDDMLNDILGKDE